MMRTGKTAGTLRLVYAGFLLLPLIPAQSVDSFQLIDAPTPRIATDSHGNLVTVQQTAIPGFCGTPCISLSARPVYAVYRYDPQGHVAQTLTSPDQVIDATNGYVTALALDATDRIYLAGETLFGQAILLRPTDPPGQTPWAPSIAGSSVRIVAIAFDPQSNPVFLVLDLKTYQNRVIKLDRTSGEILASYNLTDTASGPIAVAADPAGAIYVAGSTSSPSFPVPPAAWPAECQIQIRTGFYNCTEAFVIKLDAQLQHVGFATLLDKGSAYALAPAANGVYAGIDANSGSIGSAKPAGSIVLLDSQGSVSARSAAVPGGVLDLRLDASGNILATGNTSSGSLCGPDRPGLNLTAVYVLRLDPRLTAVSASAVIPQQFFEPYGAAALLSDGSLYVPVNPLSPASSGNRFTGARVLHVNLAAPLSPVACIVNGATFLAETQVAPGQLVTILGSGLASDPAIVFDPSQQLPFTALDTQVFVAGIAAPLIYVSPTQINVVVPYGIATGSQLPLEIRRGGNVIFAWTLDGVSSNATPLQRSPSDSTYPALANAINQDGTPNSQQNPARAGASVTIYATGFGQTTPALTDGAPGKPVSSALDAGVWTWSVADQRFVQQPARAATIPGWTNTVMAVTFQVPTPAFPGVSQLPFYLTPPTGSQSTAQAFLYVTQ